MKKDKIKKHLCMCIDFPPNTNAFVVGQQYNYYYTIDGVAVYFSTENYRIFDEITFLWYFKKI